MNSATPSALRGAAYLIVLAVLGLSIAAYLVVVSGLDLTAGRWFPSSGGGLPGLGFGAVFGTIGVFVLRRGVQAYRLLKHSDA